jgi:predicted nucleic acid-binding protein
VNLFVDTSGWIALFDRSDKYHQRARQGFQDVQRQPLLLLTSDYILAETLTHLLYTCGRSVAVEFGEWALSTQHVEVAPIDEETWTAAWQMFQTYHDKSWSFTDCTSFVRMRQRQLWQVLAFDRHFEQAGFQLWPAPDDNKSRD